tara:strand:+ start:1965 stop:2564 length:600 start_codon:yes stop_codon:yes gene_type:complete
MQTLKIRNFPVDYPDFTFKNKPKLEDYVVDIEFDSDDSHIYVDYDLSFDDMLFISDITLLDAHSYMSNDKLVFKCEYFEKDAESYEEMGEFYETIVKEISFKDLMKDSRYVGTETLGWRGWEEKFRYPTFTDAQKTFTGVEGVNTYDEKTREFESQTVVGFEFDEEKAEIKMNSVYFEIDCRNSINIKDWNVLEVYCSF